MALQPAIKVEDGKVMGAYAAQAKNVSYGSGSVEDTLDIINGKLITYIKKSLTNFSVSEAWGSLYMGNTSIDISSLGFQNVPDIVSVSYQPANTAMAIAVMAGNSANSVNIYLIRGTSSTLTGNLIIGVKSNG